jgi:hypothetical protein
MGLDIHHDRETDIGMYVVVQGNTSSGLGITATGRMRSGSEQGRVSCQRDRPDHPRTACLISTSPRLVASAFAMARVEAMVG